MPPVTSHQVHSGPHHGAQPPQPAGGLPGRGHRQGGDHPAGDGGGVTTNLKLYVNFRSRARSVSTLLTSARSVRCTWLPPTVTRRWWRRWSAAGPTSTRGRARAGPRYTRRVIGGHVSRDPPHSGPGPPSPCPRRFPTTSAAPCPA